MCERPANAFEVRATEVTNPHFTFDGETIDISSSGMAVTLPVDIRLGSLCRLEIGDSVLLGFVTGSRKWPTLSGPPFAGHKSWIGSDSSKGSEYLPQAYYCTEFEIVEVSIGTSALSQLLGANFDETMPELQLATSDSH